MSQGFCGGLCPIYGVPGKYLDIGMLQVLAGFVARVFLAVMFRR